MTVFFRPGQQLKTFKIRRKLAKTNEKGRVVYSGSKKIGELQGSISSASQKEKYEWKQMEHPISHIIVVEGTCEAQAEDILVLNNEAYCIQGKDDLAGWGIFQILYCEKKEGI